MREPHTALRARIREIAQTRVRYGYRKIRVLLKREGWDVGKMTQNPKTGPREIRGKLVGTVLGSKDEEVQDAEEGAHGRTDHRRTEAA
jgi:transposase InsO family protein